MLFKTQEKLKKTQKTPLIMSAVFDLARCSCTLVPESMLSHRPQAPHGLVPKPCHHRGKTPLSLKNRNSLCVYVVIILFTLVFNWCEIEQNAYRGIGQPHIIPQLLSLFNAYGRDRLAFYRNIPLA